MNRKYIPIAVLVVAVAAVTAVVVVNRNNSGAVDAIEAMGTTEVQEAAAITAEGVKAVQADAIGNDQVESTASVPIVTPKDEAAGKQKLEASAQDTYGVQSGMEAIVPAVAGTSKAGVEAAQEVGRSSSGTEFSEVELPAETAIPEDWDWKTFPTQAPGKDDSANGGGSSGNDNTEKSGESGSSTTEGEPEGQSAEESSQSDEEESTKEDVTEKSGEETSPAESSSEEEGSTEETEPETTTLSPEEQASIVESATAPIELPPIFFN